MLKIYGHSTTPAGPLRTLEVVRTAAMFVEAREVIRWHAQAAYRGLIAYGDRAAILGVLRKTRLKESTYVCQLPCCLTLGRKPCLWKHVRLYAATHRQTTAAILPTATKPPTCVALLNNVVILRHNLYDGSLPRPFSVTYPHGSSAPSLIK